MMFSFMNDIGNYEQRKVARDTVKGVTISTAYSSDEGYETAILDKNGVHPVERYPNKEAAKKGHSDWLVLAVNGLDGKEITKLGGMGGFVDDEKVIIAAHPDEVQE